MPYPLTEVVDDLADELAVILNSWADDASPTKMGHAVANLERASLALRQNGAQPPESALALIDRYKKLARQAAHRPLSV